MARHLSLEQMNLLESHFQLYGQVPWSELINPVWSKPFSHMEEAWLVKGAGFMHPEQERLQPATILDTRADLPPPDV